jgi:hypothetical protein
VLGTNVRDVKEKETDKQRKRRGEEESRKK